MRPTHLTKLLLHAAAIALTTLPSTTLASKDSSPTPPTPPSTLSTITRPPPNISGLQIPSPTIPIPIPTPKPTQTKILDLRKPQDTQDPTDTDPNAIPTPAPAPDPNTNTEGQEEGEGLITGIAPDGKPFRFRQTSYFSCVTLPEAAITHCGVHNQLFQVESGSSRSRGTSSSWVAGMVVGVFVVFVLSW